MLVSLCLCQFSSKATHLFNDPDERFIKLDAHGVPVGDPQASWDCILDLKTELIWEVKGTEGLRYRGNTYTWYNPHLPQNGGAAGFRNGGHCRGSRCDTHSYIDTLNRLGLCGLHTWRLPLREELRSLVDYQLHPPETAINSGYFPNTMPQFYWSATPDANDSESAWGIGFTFGYDYSYFKSDLGYVRAVTKVHKTGD